MKKPKRLSVSLPLIAFSLFCVFRGLSYLPVFSADGPATLRTIQASQFVGVYLWSGAWLTIGIVGVISSLFLNRVRSLCWSAGSGVTVAWGSTYLYTVIFQQGDPTGHYYEIIIALEYILLGAVIGALSYYSSKHDAIEEALQ